MQALTAIQGMSDIGITQINEATIKNFFFKRPYINTTGAEIKECLRKVGIKLRPCKDYIPLDYMPEKDGEVKVEHVVKPYKNRKEITKDELINLYIKQNLTTEQIAVLKKCSSNHVYSELKRQKVFTKKNSLQITLLKNINKIIYQHKEKNMKLVDIAKLYNCTTCVISKLLISNGYNPRKYSTRTKYKKKEVV